MFDFNFTIEMSKKYFNKAVDHLPENVSRTILNINENLAPKIGPYGNYVLSTIMPSAYFAYKSMDSILNIIRSKRNSINREWNDYFKAVCKLHQFDFKTVKHSLHDDIGLNKELSGFKKLTSLLTKESSSEFEFKHQSLKKRYDELEKGKKDKFIYRAIKNIPTAAFYATISLAIYHFKPFSAPTAKSCKLF